MHGTGVYTWTSGEKYDGEWSDSTKEGFGKSTMVNKDVYEG